MYGLGFGAFRHAMIGSLNSGSANGALTTAWITATGETDPTIIGALNTLETDLTTYGLTSKMKALYPFVGGTAAKHSYNFMNTSLFPISWFGGGTHSSTGYLTNGTNAYGNTGFSLSGNLSQNSVSLGVYSRTSNSSNGAHGVHIAGTCLFSIWEQWTNGLSYIYPNTTGGSGLIFTNSLGFFQGSRNDSANILHSRNSATSTATEPSATLSSANFYIGAVNNGATAAFYQNRELSFFYIGNGLLNGDLINFNTIVQAFQTTLSRQV